jgi:hypothetical protein
MDYLEIKEGLAILALNDEDIRLVLAMITETFEAVEDFELHTRTGFCREEIEDFRSKLRGVRSELAKNHGAED